jgi:hypothetical protein
MYMIRTAKFVILLAAATPGLAQPQPFAIERYRVTQQGGGLGVDVDETMVVSVVIEGGRKRWIAERRRHDRDRCGGRTDRRCAQTDRTVHDWIDGDACPKLTAAFVDLARLRLSGFAPPWRSGVDTVSDTPLVTVSGTPDRMSGLGARLSLAAFTGPVVEWWTRSERLLAPCWTTRPPMSNGRPLGARLPPE